MKTFMKTILLMTLILTNFSYSLDTASFATIPIVHQGRIVPFDTYARSTVTKFSSSKFLKTLNPVDFCLKLFNTNKSFSSQKIFSIDSKKLQEILLFSDEQLYSQEEIVKKPEFIQYSKYYQKQVTNKEAFTVDMLAYAKLLKKFDYFKEYINGQDLYLFPRKEEKADWFNLVQIQNSTNVEDQATLQLFIQLLVAINKGDQTSFDNATALIKALTSKLSQSNQADRLTTEYLYNLYQPNQIALMLFIITFAMIPFLKNRKIWYFSIISGLFALLVTALSFLFRSYILQRPALGTMYEVLLLCSLISASFSIFLFKSKDKQNYYLLSTLTSLVILALANLLPISQSLENLDVILSNSIYLSFHVFFVASSFVLFTLSSVLAHYYLYVAMKHEAIPETLMPVIHKLIKLGVLLLGFGTVIGGIWANQTWGRFWAWDPKETWVFITMTSYMVLLHCKRVGWFQDYIVALCTILSYITVLMTWYGMNFLLNNGLHSFAFATGNAKVAILFVLFELLFISTVQRKRLSKIHA
ncbi:cytochrome c biogenesis protein CcsA [bacterium]|nr:cytochrome c biogenesis protein CcsA [bacterium]